MGNTHQLSDDDLFMSVNLIGNSMEKLLWCLSEKGYSSLAKERSTKLSLLDYWDYHYYPDLSFNAQLDAIIKKINDQKKQLALNFRECLIIKVENINSEEIKYCLQKVNEIKRDNYIPLILFLCNKLDRNELSLDYIKNNLAFENIDNRMIFFEEYEDQIYYEERIKNILKILEKFCSYYNELGDRFSIGKGNKEIFYDLTEKNYPFTINICCIGRFGTGKSTGVNILLNEKKAKENKGGTSVTKRINFYQVNQFPLKIFDIPGFENEETIKNTVNKLKELHSEIEQLQDQLHIILYFLKSTDERMFTEMEIGIFKQIIKHKDTKVIYILTHSNTNVEKEEIYDMINFGIKSIIMRHKNNKKNKEQEFQNKLLYEDIKKSLIANKENCIFVNFHKTKKCGIFGISDLFTKIADFVISTNAYKSFQKGSYKDEEEFRFKIEREAEIRKIRAKHILFRHKIGSGVISLIPGVDWAVQKFVIKKDAVKKVGEIFGLDVKYINQILDKQNEENQKKKQKKKDNKNEIEKIKISTNNINDDIEKIENFEDDKKINKKLKRVRVGGYAVSAFSSAVSYSSGLSSLVFAVSEATLLGISVCFSFVSSAVCVGLGSYLMSEQCESLINNMVEIFKSSAKELSNSLEVGIQYLREMAEIYKDTSLLER